MIECELRQPKPERTTRRVQYRKYSAIDGSRLTADLAASDPNVPEQNPEVILVDMMHAYIASLLPMPQYSHGLSRLGR